MIESLFKTSVVAQKCEWQYSQKHTKHFYNVHLLLFFYNEEWMCGAIHIHFIGNIKFQLILMVY